MGLDQDIYKVKKLEGWSTTDYVDFYYNGKYDKTNYPKWDGLNRDDIFEHIEYYRKNYILHDAIQAEDWLISKPEWLEDVISDLCDEIKENWTKYGHIRWTSDSLTKLIELYNDVDWENEAVMYISCN